ncbi:GntR family transcriptional regulator [Kordiimonas marina]|uniref:GntR family transcriptional regulator n=1 Tax=Kordiimonas marina TaxID=2872312 RepID=UPI001FF5D3AD|nr:GntR family transcriptional regulator [Kordiimonas marina]MCJ9427768.1 GntR family transcriptional regulator [Kordiimonas marina]
MTDPTPSAKHKPRSRQKQKATEIIRDLVIQGKYKPGQRISELSVAELTGISRTPARLALGQLAYEGILKPLPRGGFVVQDFSVKDIFDAIELRGTLEGTAAKMAAQKVTDEDSTKELERICRDLDTLIGNRTNEPDLFEKYTDLNRQFHDEMLRMADCPLLERTLDHVAALPFASPNAFVRVHDDIDKKYDILFHAQHQHRMIVEAIRRGDSGRAYSVTLEHAMLAAANLREAMQQEDVFQQIPGSTLVRTP